MVNHLTGNYGKRGIYTRKIDYREYRSTAHFSQIKIRSANAMRRHILILFAMVVFDIKIGHLVREFASHFFVRKCVWNQVCFLADIGESDLVLRCVFQGLQIP